MLFGRDYAIDGARLLPELYPDTATWPDVSDRLLPRARLLLLSETRWPVGFFLFGVSEAARRGGYYGQ